MSSGTQTEQSARARWRRRAQTAHDTPHRAGSCDASSGLGLDRRWLAATDGDVDPSRLGLLLDRHPQPQYAVGVVGADALCVQRVSQEQLAAERTGRAFPDQRFDAVVSRPTRSACTASTLRSTVRLIDAGSRPGSRTEQRTRRLSDRRRSASLPAAPPCRRPAERDPDHHGTGSTHQHAPDLLSV